MLHAACAESPCCPSRCDRERNKNGCRLHHCIKPQTTNRNHLFDQSNASRRDDKFVIKLFTTASTLLPCQCDPLQDVLPVTADQIGLICAQKPKDHLDMNAQPYARTPCQIHKPNATRSGATCTVNTDMPSEHADHASVVDHPTGAAALPPNPPDPHPAAPPQAALRAAGTRSPASACANDTQGRQLRATSRGAALPMHGPQSSRR